MGKYFTLSKLQFTLLLSLFIIRFIIRVYQLQSVPFGFHDDEVDAGYIGRYILLHGEDFYGNKFPFYFDKLDYVTFTQELYPSSKVKETSLIQQNILVIDNGDFSYDGKLFRSLHEIVRKDSTYAFHPLEPISL